VFFLQQKERYSTKRQLLYAEFSTELLGIESLIPKSVPEFDELLSTAHRLADAAGKAILPYFRKTVRVDDKIHSIGFDPVTEADRKAEDVIRTMLEAAWPDHGIVGEEFAEKETDSGNCWIIDPIDGTRAFIMGYPLWGTLIGFSRDGEPILGLMDQPFTGERYWSDRTSTRYRGPDGVYELSTRKCKTLQDAFLSTTSPELFETDDEIERFEALKDNVRMTRYGGDCYAYCQLAAGQIDVIVESGLKPFDVMPLITIIERAGGRVTNWQGESAAMGGQILASGDAKIHDLILKKFLC
jgi:histidinol phosphatase-like enzyme (inositol monophosphatase family)